MDRGGDKREIRSASTKGSGKKCDTGLPIWLHERGGTIFRTAGLRKKIYKGSAQLAFDEGGGTLHEGGDT